MPVEQHSHQYGGVTSINQGHVHYLSGYTTFNDGHSHYYAVAI